MAPAIVFICGISCLAARHPWLGLFCIIVAALAAV